MQESDGMWPMAHRRLEENCYNRVSIVKRFAGYRANSAHAEKIPDMRMKK
jgi:hypothetical protein